MTDMFLYNSGSLFQALKPEQNLTPGHRQPWVAEAWTSFKDSRQGRRRPSTARRPARPCRRRDPLQHAIYEKLGLKVPKTWAEFMANNAKIKAPGSPGDPDLRGHLDLAAFVLADFHNV